MTDYQTAPSAHNLTRHSVDLESGLPRDVPVEVRKPATTPLQNFKRIIAAGVAVILLITVLGYGIHNQEDTAHRRLPCWFQARKGTPPKQLAVSGAGSEFKAANGCYSLKNNHNTPPVRGVKFTTAEWEKLTGGQPWYEKNDGHCILRLQDGNWTAWTIVDQYSNILYSHNNCDVATPPNNGWRIWGKRYKKEVPLRITEIPAKLKVSGAGTGEANGCYSFVGFNNDDHPVYGKKDGHKIVFYTATKEWLVMNQRLDVLYFVESEAAIPPMNGWRRVLSGKAPAPKIEYK